MPDGDLVAFLPVRAARRDQPAANGRYLQYRATLTTTDVDQTPELQDVLGQLRRLHAERTRDLRTTASTRTATASQTACHADADRDAGPADAHQTATATFIRGTPYG